MQNRNIADTIHKTLSIINYSKGGGNKQIDSFIQTTGIKEVFDELEPNCVELFYLWLQGSI